MRDAIKAALDAGRLELAAQLLDVLRAAASSGWLEEPHTTTSRNGSPG
jgi:hypothetical protein